MSRENDKKEKKIDVSDIEKFRKLLLKKGGFCYNLFMIFYIENLSADTYFLRLKATNTSFASAIQEIVIEEGRQLTVTLPTGQVGYTLTSDLRALDWHGGVTFTFTLAPGYTMMELFAMQVNGQTVTLVKAGETNIYTYTLSNAENDVTVSITGVADVTRPNEEITVQNHSWKEFLNTVTFGLFFKESTDVTITAADANTGSGIDTVEYLLSETAFTSEESEVDFWTSLTADSDGIYGFAIQPNQKGFVYVRVQDHAGNMTIINSEGIVVYTDAEQDTEEITFTKLSGTDTSFQVTLHGNTVKLLTLETTDPEGQTKSQSIDSTNYTVRGDTITLKADYLQSLAAGTYTVRVEYNPMGESYIEAVGNILPASTTVQMHIQQVTGTMTIDGDIGKTYDGTAVSPDYTRNNLDGQVIVEYKAQNAEDSAYTTISPKDAGKYTVRVTVEADAEGNYTEASATQNFIITPKTLTVHVAIRDKQYDGRDTALFEGMPSLEGVVGGDIVLLIHGEPMFDSIAVGTDTEIHLTDFDIEGEDADNYVLIQPTGLKASIYNQYTAAQGTDYTVNSNDWLNEDFVTTATKGYSLSLTNTVEGCWTQNLTVSKEMENGTLTFYVKNDTTGAISRIQTEHYKIDKTAPVGEIRIGTNVWREFLNTITFDMFFKDTQTVSIDSEDTMSGIASVAYAASDTVLSLEEVKNLTWTEGMNVSVESENGKQFVYYARLTDFAGNVTYLSTNGAEFDTTLPVIGGITDGETYCVSANITVSDDNLSTVTVDSKPVVLENGTYTETLAAGEHTIIAMDRAGNEAMVIITVNANHTPEADDEDCTTAIYCTLCDAVTTEAQEHDFSGAYLSDENGHWHQCQNAGCTATNSKTEHTRSNGGDCTQDTLCSACGYVMTEGNEVHDYVYTSNGDGTHSFLYKMQLHF